MPYRCCALHDAADRTIDSIINLLKTEKLSDDDRAAWFKRLDDAIYNSAFVVEQPDGSVHVRSIA